MDASFDYVRRIIPATEAVFSVPGAWWLSGSAIDLYFSTNQIYPSGTFTDYLSCSRASIGYAQTAAGTLTQFGTNTLRITDLGLLVEDARTNLVLHSQDFSDGYWNYSLYYMESITTTTTAPDGTNTAQPLKPTTDTGYHQIKVQTALTTTANPATLSCYFKKHGYNYAVLHLTSDSSYTKYFEGIFNLNTGAVEGTSRAVGYTGSRSIEAMGDGWYRCIITVDTTDASSDVRVAALVQDTNAADRQFAGDGASEIFAWGMQLEQAAFPSSYIPTTTTSATRAADGVSCIGSLNTIFSGLPFTAVMDTKLDSPLVTGIANGMYVSLGQNAGTDNYIYNNSNDTEVASTLNSVGLVIALGNAKTFTSGVKIGTALATSDRAICGGGGTVATDSNTLAFATTNLGNNSFGTVFGHYRRLTVWNSRLVNAMLQGFTYP